MYKSILQFCENGTMKLDEISADFFEEPKDIASFVGNVKDVVVGLGCSYLGEIFETMDEMIRDSGIRKRNWEIVRRDKKTMLTSLGEISYRKTLFKNKKTGDRTYLLDRYLGIEANARLTEDAEAALLSEAAQTSYRRAGKAASISDDVSKSTVKNRLHGLQFPPHAEESEEKRKVRNLYIDADEDHVALQFFESKGDIRPDKKGRTYNTVQTKLIYVYEGIEPEAPSSKRNKLINAHYFSGVYEGKENDTLWNEVNEYIEAKYDIDSIEKIYLNSDGGSWIKKGKSKIGGIITVLDEYHINKYLTKMTTHLFDSAQDGRNILRNVIKKGTKEEFRKTVQRLAKYTEEESVKARINSSMEYILSNWIATRMRLRRSAGVVGSSTEGHVSHVLASRMSSRPLGWSRKGADQMARLRAYEWNGGSMLDLVRYQREPLQKAAGAEIFSADSILAWEKHHENPNGKYVDKLQHSLGASVRKTLAIRDRLMEI